MSKARKTVSAKEVVGDIRAGITDAQLMQKYGLSEKGVENLFRKLIEAGVVSEAQFAEREIAPRRTQDSQKSPPESSQTAKIPAQPVQGDYESKSGHVTAFEVQAVAGAKGKWNLQLESDVLRIESADGTGQVEVPRSERTEKVELRKPLMMSPLIIIHERKKKTFRLDGNQLEALNQWIGPATTESLKVGLRRRFKFCLGIGILWIVLSAPLPGDPATGIEPLPIDVFGAALGAFLISLALLSRYWINRNVFLLDGSWFLLAAGKVTYGVYKGDSPWWLILSAFLVYFAVGGVREYVRFKDV